MWHRKQSDGKPKSLPTNIEDANPKYVGDRLAAWDARVSAERATHLRVTREAASQIEPKPLYLVEAEKRAEAEGRSLESILGEYVERLKRSGYPGPNCFLPDEIMEYAEGALSQERLAHAQGCPACATLLSASQPLERAEREVREAIRQQEGATVPEPVFAPAWAFSGASRWIPVLESWAGVVLLPAVVLLVAYVYFWRVDSSATRLTFVNSWIPWVVAGVMALLTLVTFTAPRLRPVMRSVGAGAAVGIVAASFLLTNFRQSQISRDLAVTYAQDRLESICADSIQNQRRTGKFLETYQSVGLFQLDTAMISSTQATYTLTGKELPGKVVCNVGAAGGDLKWEYGNTVSERVRLLAGTVHNTDEGVTLKVADGKYYPLEPANGVPHITPGAFVLGVVDPKTSAVRAVRVISTASEERSVAAAAMPSAAKLQ